ncbi:MAG TPA: 30S ribosomal protein S4 [Anaerolineae bacterium]|nr:30S ribosomal protein S4 [Anaerolineae bacterium]HOQ99446.1 30S ribosomal protein S4 [Anaerolineae bacterium]HPL27752.1 30S ribosomal protein S4 [Anaerolineae bacterium]
MAKYVKSVCKLCRREGEKLYLKGEKCYSDKCPVSKRAYAPGMHGKKAQFRRKMSDYGLQLREKQKARRIYGVLEAQFRRYFADAERVKGITGLNLLRTLESRLDNVVYRLGFGSSRNQARQLVRHGHIQVNGVKVNIPSYLVKPGDVVAVRERSRQRPEFKDLAQVLERHTAPDWLGLEAASLSGRVLSQPTREAIDIPLREQLIVEFYSR